MRRVRDDLTGHVGSNPSVTQRLLIQRAVILSLRVAQIDARILAGEPLGLRDNNYALAWNNALRRTLSALGVAGADASSTIDQPQAGSHLREIMAEGLGEAAE